MTHSDDWMAAIASQEEPILLDNWPCYYYNGTKRMSVRELPTLIQNNLTNQIFGYNLIE